MRIFIVSIFLLYQSTDALLDTGYAHYEQGKYKEAIKSFNQVIDLDPSNPEAYFLRAMSLQSIKQTELAIADLKRAIMLKADYAEAFQQLGYIYLVEQAPNLAVKAFDKAISLAPELAELYVNRGSAHCMMDNEKQANEDYQKAQKMGINYAEYMNCDK
jgi:Flp pilus assembly protein TadD